MKVRMMAQYENTFSFCARATCRNRPPTSAVGVLLGLQLQRDVDELVLLATDQLALPGLEQDLRAGDAVAFCRVPGVLEERAVDAGIAHHQRHPVQRALIRHRRAYDVLCRVDDLQEIDPGVPPERSEE